MKITATLRVQDERPANVQDKILVVIDVLRASTTICTALENGAEAVFAFETVEEARRAAQAYTQKKLLGGERKGVRIDGFDLDNSPRAYVTEICRGKTIFFTTTNGTKALSFASHAGQTYVGCLRNLTAVANAAAKEERDVHVLCAGTNGEIAGEDVFCAGGIISRLQDLCKMKLSDAAQIAVDFYRTRAADPLDLVRSTLGGRNVIAVGLEQDVTFCAAVDVSAVVPLVSGFPPRITAQRS